MVENHCAGVFRVGEPPAELLHAAATRLHRLAAAATPGPWERPLDVCTPNFVGAALPADEGPQDDVSGIIQDYGQDGYQGRYVGHRERCAVVSAPTRQDGAFSRRRTAAPGKARPPSRSGPDLDYIASLHPLFGEAAAAWLDEAAAAAAKALSWNTPGCPHDDGPCGCDSKPGWGCDLCGDWLGSGCHCWDKALDVARVYLTPADPA